MKPWVKTVVAGVGFLSDAYDLFIIDVVKNVMAEIYPQTVGDTSAVSTAALVGAVLGQITFGALADVLGRRLIFISTLLLVLLGCFGSATATSGSTVGIYAQLAIWRFILGFGVGGEYPLSATVTTESSTAKNRGVAMAAVFSMQGVGKILAAGVNAACLSSGMPLDSAWRVALLLGGVPGLLTIYHRWQLEESHIWKERVLGIPSSETGSNNASSSMDSPLAVLNGHGPTEAIPSTPSPSPSTPAIALHRVTSDSETSSILAAAAAVNGTPSPSPSQSFERGPTQAAPSRVVRLPPWMAYLVGPAATLSIGRTLATIWEYRWTLAGTAGNWFLLDVTFYGQGLFSGTVLGIAGLTANSVDGRHSREELLTLATGSLVLVAIAMPGYLVALATIERMGRRRMQLMGFCACTIIFLILGAELKALRGQYKGLFVFLYGLTFFFSNFGANMTTFILPAELFPTRARATCHGLSAAAGKLGAVLGSSGMPPLLTAYGTDAAAKDRGLVTVMYVCAAVSLLGLAWTWMFTPETAGVDLESLEGSESVPLAVHGNPGMAAAWAGHDWMATRWAKYGTSTSSSSSSGGGNGSMGSAWEVVVPGASPSTQKGHLDAISEDPQRIPHRGSHSSVRPGVQAMLGRTSTSAAAGQATDGYHTQGQLRHAYGVSE